MKLEQLGVRIDELIALASKALTTKKESYFGGDIVTSEDFSEFRTASLSFLQIVFGVTHPYYKDFDHEVRDINAHMVEYGSGILKAVKGQIEGGWLLTVKSLVSAEIFTDFLEKFIRWNCTCKRLYS